MADREVLGFDKYENLIVEIERIRGRLEAITDLKNQLIETTRTFSEEIGELRTMILDREKSFSKIEIGFEKINEIVKEIEPQTIRKNFEKKEQKILELEARIEKLERFSKELIKQTEKVREVIEKVKSFENLVSVAERVKKYLRQAEETKNYADRIAGKVETMFENVDNKIINFNEKTEKLDKVDEVLKELVPTVDKLQVEIKNEISKNKAEMAELGLRNIQIEKNMKKQEEYFKKISKSFKREMLKVREQDKKIKDIKKELNKNFALVYSIKRDMKKINDETMKLLQRNMREKLKESEKKFKILLKQNEKKINKIISKKMRLKKTKKETSIFRKIVKKIFNI